MNRVIDTSVIPTQEASNVPKEKPTSELTPLPLTRAVIVGSMAWLPYDEFILLRMHEQEGLWREQ